MKKVLTEEGEACTLIGGVANLTVQLVDNFVKYSKTGGCIKMEKESSHFVATVKLERKKEVKKRR